MGRRKKRSTKKSTKNNLEKELKFVFGLILGILFTVIIYGKSGVLNKEFEPILSGILGPIKYILPIGILYFTLSDVVKEEAETNSRLKLFMLVILLLCSLLMIYNISKFKINVNLPFDVLVRECFNLGKRGHGGGAVGALIAVPAIKMLGTTGASIVIVFASILLGLLSLGASTIDYFKELNTNLSERKQILKLKKVEEKAQKYQRLKEKQENIEQIKEKIEEIEPEEKSKFPLLAFLNKNETNVNETEKEDEEEKQELNINMPDHNKSYSKLLAMHNLDGEEVRPTQVRPQVVRKIEVNKKKIENNQDSKGDGILYSDLDLSYKFPSVELLNLAKNTSKVSKTQIEKTAIGLQKTLLSFGVSAKVQNVTVGPAVTRYELKPAVGVKVNRIKNLADDIALSLAASTIRIEAPIPGKRAVGIEVPNEKQAAVSFREVIDTPEFLENKSPLAFALGKGIDGKAVVADLDKMRHLMIAGATGSGKSVCINTIINSIIYHSSPLDVKMIMIDPKVVELSNYNKIPHLCQSVVTDPEKASLVLKWCVDQMTKRYNKFAEYRAKDLDTYNKKVEKTEPEKQIPRLVILVDELADLMMAAAKDVEDSICRIAQMGRAAGIHLIIATQRPSADVITGLIKANIPSRIAFSVTSGTDSRIILDMNGAEKLLGKGDMLYFPMGATQPHRVQGAFITDEEIAGILNEVSVDEIPEVRRQVEENFEKIEEEKNKPEETDESEEDEVLFDAIDTILEFKQASKTFLRRKFSMGDLRAGRVIDRIEELGVIGPQISTKPRDILVTKPEWEQMKLQIWPDLFTIKTDDDEYIEEGNEDLPEFEETYDENPNEEKKIKENIKTNNINAREERKQEKILDDDFFESELIKPQKTYFENGEEKIIRDINKYQETDEAANILLNQVSSQKTNQETKVDPLLKVAVETVIERNNPSSDGIVNSLGINPSRADKLIQQMLDIGIIINDGNKNLLNITPSEWDIMKENF